MSRTPAEIRDELLIQLMPSGWAWPKSTQANMAALLTPFAIMAAQFEADIDALRNEISPAKSTLLLADYAQVLGPDPCGRDLADLTTAEMQALLNSRWVGGGGQSEQFFIDLAQAAGVTITIDYPEPAICGEAVCGVDVCSQDTDRLIWIINLPNKNTGLECPIQRFCPPDTALVFNYTDAA
ncbi:hypothetical protein Geu3261_0144_002 [Komagataeibacter europaeus NBRC 3261]|uniref:Bacteriophage tail protein n=1 Tax=Komagataeibacter europaeus NBRC 3261 TaxID=1234669 RepID=A0A0D6Q2C5_KOMEU|nr:putative phage tail protein [Komagataeibacter europaeus]GAN97130.1 hypothetical protein Geu3261_0144_002 [Komagataeibacter europaeus NBRC 3261]